ncbi:energy-coupling factor ABC transporter ATP-binding protein [Treponema sp. TIM-1]|uniref:energy-coupling factor ABC transporter ATP-binding protein n=1 Tax=Treponema sp. TIM-1 TaxID=2898417 RepID=UPI00397F6721
MGIRDVSFEAAPGERIALVGANGAGKTSLLLILAGVLPLLSGEFTLDGITIKAGLAEKARPFKKDRLSPMDELRCRAALVFQNPEDQLFMPTIYEDLAFGPRNMGMGEDEVRRRVEEVLEKLGISGLKERSPLKLSGGEKRIAAIASVLTMNPSVMLFDEPTVFLDPKARRNLIRVMASLPHTKLVATHDLSFAAEACDRVILLREGRILDQGRAADILKNSGLLEEVFL